MSFLLRRLVTTSLALGLAQLPPVSLADTPDQELIRQQEREKAQRERLEALPALRLPPPETGGGADWPADETPCFPIHTVRLDGEQAERFRRALAAIGDPAGRCLGALGIAAAARRVQQAIASDGYVTTRVLVGAQHLDTGILTLTVLPGRLRAIRDETASRLRPAHRNAIPVRPGDLLNLRDIEQGLENLKRVPSTEAALRIEPAEQPGISDLVLSGNEAFPYRLTLSADDGGSRSTGRYQGTVTLSIDNLLTLSDLFYFSTGRSLGGDGGPRHGTRNSAVHYSLPFGYWLLGANASDYDYFQTVASPVPGRVYRGNSRNAQLSLSRVLLRSAERKTTLALRGWRRQSSNHVDDNAMASQRRRTAGWELSLGQRAHLAGSLLEGTLTWRRGTGAFNALPAPGQRLGEEDARGGFLRADLGLTLPFSWPGQRWRYAGTLRGQWSDVALTPQDRFAIGGRYSVRGFDGELSLTGERGWLIRNELGLSPGGGSQELYLGLDHGRVGGPSARRRLGPELSGAVIGWRGGRSRLNWDLFAGWPLRKPTGFRTARTTGGFSINSSF